MPEGLSDDPPVITEYHTVRLLVTVCSVVGLSYHAIQNSDILLQLRAILTILAPLTTSCVELCQCSTTVQQTVALFATVCFVVGLACYTVQPPGILLLLCAILIILAGLRTRFANL
jgi:hypothetical protein